MRFQFVYVCCGGTSSSTFSIFFFSHCRAQCDHQSVASPHALFLSHTIHKYISLFPQLVQHQSSNSSSSPRSSRAAAAAAATSALAAAAARALALACIRRSVAFSVLSVSDCCSSAERAEAESSPHMRARSNCDCAPRTSVFWCAMISWACAN